MAAASSHTHKYSNVSNPSSEGPSQEPIYQNQFDLLKEPIYQNLPLVMHQEGEEEGANKVDHDQIDQEQVSKGHVSRVAITNSREDLSQHTEYIQPTDNGNAFNEVDSGRKKSVTKINIVASDHESEEINKSETKTPPKKPARLKATSQSVENIMAISDDSELNLTPTPLSSSKANTMHTPRTPSSKPRAGRKRWAFNFGGSKTGSLKSLKSLKSNGGGDDDEEKK